MRWALDHRTSAFDCPFCANKEASHAKAIVGRTAHGYSPHRQIGKRTPEGLWGGANVGLCLKAGCMRRALYSIWTTLFIVLLELTTHSMSGTLFADTAEGYHRIARLTLGGEGFWDYLAIDQQARRLYISRWSHVMVVDADSYKLVGDIPGIQGVHGIAVAPEFGRGFITEDEANRITIFDLRTLKKTATAKTGNSPDGIIYDPNSKRVFVFSGDGKVTAVNAATGEVVGSAELGGNPECNAPRSSPSRF